MKVWKITLYFGDKPQGSYIEKDVMSIADGNFDSMEPGSDDWFKIECVEMSETEYNNLPEFMGW